MYTAYNIVLIRDRMTESMFYIIPVISQCPTQRKLCIRRWYSKTSRNYHISLTVESNKITPLLIVSIYIIIFISKWLLIKIKRGTDVKQGGNFSANKPYPNNPRKRSSEVISRKKSLYFFAMIPSMKIRF